MCKIGWIINIFCLRVYIKILKTEKVFDVFWSIFYENHDFVRLIKKNYNIYFKMDLSMRKISKKDKLVFLLKSKIVVVILKS